MVQVLLSLLVVASTVSDSDVPSRLVTLEERLEARLAIEAVYRAHVVGNRRSTDQSLRREYVRGSVLDDLKLSMALERLWATPITDAALQAELQRIARDTRVPSRLHEIYDALDGDAAVIREALARPVLVRRLARRFFTSDARIHGESRLRIEELRDRVANGTLDPSAVGPIEETPTAFRFGVRRVDADGQWRQERLEVAKLTWDEWWASTRDSFDPAGAIRPSSSTLTLPTPQAAAEAAGSAACSPDDTWANGILDDHPDPRHRHGAVWTGTHMIVWGGEINNDPVGSGAIYDPLTDSWSPISNVGAPRARTGHGTIWTGSEMIVWGGDTWPDRTNTGGRYDPTTDTWTPVSTVGAPEARRSHVTVWTGNEMIVWGGTGAIANPVQFQSGGRYDPATDSWTPTNLVGAPEARRAATAVWTGNEMIVWGGSTGVSTGDVVNTGGRYDPAADSWTPTGIVGAPLPRMQHSAVWTGSEMIIFAGRSAGGTGSRYDPLTDSWTATSLPTIFGWRFNHSAVWTGSEMIVWGGDEGDGISDERGDGERYDPLTDSWAPISGVNAPSPRTNASGVWTGDRLIVWGGESSGRDFLSGGRYNPTTDSWTPTHVSDAPGIRQDHAAVWTGTELIVWGGIAPGRDLYLAAPLDAGGRYDPLVDTWTPTASAGAPSARHGHTAVWTGDEMLLWGGIDTGPTDTGARYDPLLDRWLSLSTTGAPAGRDQHSATWTGNEMVVWGGRLQDGTETDTGGRYDPDGDAWTALPAINAPSPRRLHTAVWADGDVMVWGGLADVLGDVVELDTGARYSVAFDAWIPIPRLGAPSPRYAHASLWTGSELIVWGGRDDTNGTTLGDGARYDRGINLWQAVGGAGAPEARRSASAVWTGDRMIVWGGESPEFVELSSGGRYDPVSDVWTSTSQLHSPQGRLEASLAWTGDSALIWGGHAGGHGLNTGGVYTVGNPDADLDGVADGCDCNPTDSSAFAAPPEVGGLLFAGDKTTLGWDSLAASAGTGTEYDVLRGSMAELPVGGGPSETCLPGTGTQATASDTAIPVLGDGFSYLVRGRNSCGTGTYGFETAGAERLSSACP